MKITECTHGAVDKDGDVSFEATIAIENITEHNIELVKTSLLIVDQDGGTLCGSYNDEHDVFIDPASSDTISLHSWANRLLGAKLEKSKMIVCAAYFRRDFHKIGIVDIPKDHKEIAALSKTTDVSGGALKVFGAAIKRDKPDDDGDVNIHASVGIRNLTDQYIERATLKIVLIDQEEAVLEEDTSYESLPPNMSVVLEPSIRQKKGRLRNCQVRLSLSTYSGVGHASAEAVCKEEE